MRVAEGKHGKLYFAKDVLCAPPVEYCPEEICEWRCQYTRTGYDDWTNIGYLMPFDKLERAIEYMLFAQTHQDLPRNWDSAQYRVRNVKTGETIPLEAIQYAE